MLVFQRTKIKTLCENVYFRYIFLLLVADISSLFSKNSNILVSSRQTNVHKIADYPSTFRDDAIYYNEDFESTVKKSPNFEKSFDTEHTPRNRTKVNYDAAEGDQNNNGEGMFVKKHHKHRHKNKKTMEETNESFEIFFNKLAAKTIFENEDNLERRVDEEVYPIEKDELKYHNVETDSFSSPSSIFDDTPLDNLDDLVKKEFIENHQHHHHHHHHSSKKGHSPKNHFEYQTEIDPYLYEINYVNPTVQELIMMTPELAHLDIPWPVKKEAIVEGDVNLGGLMMVHSREDGVTCGPIMPQGGIQALEAMLYTLDILNKRLKLIPNVTIGAHILDDCDKDTYGLEMAVDFIKVAWHSTRQGYNKLVSNQLQIIPLTFGEEKRNHTVI